MVMLRMFIVLSLFGVNMLLCNAKLRLCDLSEDNHQTYDDVYKICCNNAIQLRINEQQECCDDRITYFKNKQLCCGGKVMDLFVRSNVKRDSSSHDVLYHKQACCGGKPVDEESTMCCQHKVINLSDAQVHQKDSLVCCGDNITNMHTHFCCNDLQFLHNSLFGCCGEKVFDKQAEKCLRNYNPPRVLEKYKKICNNSEYDTRKNSCCSDVLYDLPARKRELPTEWNTNQQCCDHLIYDTTKHKCCRERLTGYKTHLISSEAGIYCCGEGYYNETCQDCHDGKVLQKEPRKQSCGSKYVDGVTEGCCADALTYNTNTHSCCEGHGFNIIPKNEVCCNGEGITDNKLCCADIIPCNKNNITDDECCYNEMTSTGATYSSKNNQHCFDGHVVQALPGTKPCTRFSFYNPDTQICCGGKVGDISSDHNQCCDGILYNSKSQQCCDSEISNIPVTEGRCCLVDSKVYRFEDPSNPCISSCNDTSYDYSNEVCCDGIVHTLHSNTECCGSSAIDSSTTDCCGGQFPLTRNGKMKCCGNRDLFDKRYSKCRNGKVVLKDAKLRKHFREDVQRMCHPTALKYFDGVIDYACTSQHVVKARVINFQISEKSTPNITIINMSLSRVKSLSRQESLATFSNQRSIHFVIEVPTSDGVVCKKKYLEMYCEVIIFFNGPVRHEHVKIKGNSKFFIASYTRQREKILTKQLSHKFCLDNFIDKNKS